VAWFRVKTKKKEEEEEREKEEMWEGGGGGYQLKRVSDCHHLPGSRGRCGQSSSPDARRLPQLRST
jgi:hypothetical protein